MTSHTTPTTRVDRLGVALSLGLFLFLLGLPREAAGQDGTFTEMGFNMGGGPRLGVAERSGAEGDLFASLNLIRIEDRRYRSFGVEGSYVWDPALDFFSVMARLEFGLKKGRFGERHDSWADFNTPYVGLMVGYGSGAVWDETYVDLYGAVDDVEVVVTGIPIYASLGWRSIGSVGFSMEAIGGVTVITSQEADLPEGTAPSIIPGIGFRIALSYDTFSYKWSYY